MATVKERSTALAGALLTRDQCDKALQGARKFLDATLGMSKQGGVIANFAGLSTAIKGAVIQESKSIDKLKRELDSWKGEGVSENFRYRVALSMVQSQDLLKRVDEAVHDPEIHFYPDFTAFLKDVGQLAAKVVSGVVGAFPIWVPIGVGVVALGFLALKGRR